MTYRLHRHRLHAAWLALAEHIAVHERLAQQTGAILDSIAAGRPGVDEHLERLAKAVGRPHGQADVGAALVGYIRMQMLRRKLLEEGQQGWVPLRCAVLQRSGEVDLARDVSGGRESLGHGDVRGGLVIWVAVVAEQRTELRRQGGGIAVSGGAGGLVWRGRPSLWFGGLGLEGVEGEEAQIGQAWEVDAGVSRGPFVVVMGTSLINWSSGVRGGHMRRYHRLEGMQSQLTTSNISNSGNLKVSIVLLHGTGLPVRRRHGIVMTEVLRKWLIGSQCGRAGGRCGGRVHHAVPG